MSEAKSSQQTSTAELEACPSNQYCLGPSRILILWNGSKWAGESPDPLSLLIQRLERYALDPVFEECGNFASIAHGSFHHHGYQDDGMYVDYYEDTGPMFDDAPYAVIFFGNFLKLSAGFSIVTDDPEIVEVLLEAIRTNQRSTAYQEARREVAMRRRSR